MSDATTQQADLPVPKRTRTSTDGSSGAAPGAAPGADAASASSAGAAPGAASDTPVVVVNTPAGMTFTTTDDLLQQVLGECRPAYAGSQHLRLSVDFTGTDGSHHEGTVVVTYFPKDPHFAVCVTKLGHLREGPYIASYPVCMDMAFSPDNLALLLTSTADKLKCNEDRVQVLEKYFDMVSEVLMLLPEYCIPQFFKVLSAVPFLSTNLDRTVRDALCKIVLGVLKKQVACHQFAGSMVAYAFENLQPGLFDKLLMSADHVEFLQKIITTACEA